MINARIHDGDLVFVRKQEQVENGEIAVVLIEDEATLKRVFYDEKKATLTLVAENPKYPPFVYQGEELVNIKIIGKAVAFQSNIR
jgi:repressor LexA